MQDRYRTFPVRVFVLTLAGLALCGAFPQAAAAQSHAELSAVRQVRDLPPGEAAGERPVRLHGVVTAVSGWNFSFFFQDGTSGISVDRSGPIPEVHPGDRVEVSGVSDAGKFAPIIKAQSVTVLGEHTKLRWRCLAAFGGVVGFVARSLRHNLQRPAAVCRGALLCVVFERHHRPACRANRPFRATCHHSCHCGELQFGQEQVRADQDQGHGYICSER